MSMVEVVARAITISEGHDPDARWKITFSEAGHQCLWEKTVPKARAAIEAMREPTKEMVVAGYDAYDEAKDIDYDSRDGSTWETLPAGSIGKIWQDMIASALKEET